MTTELRNLPNNLPELIDRHGGFLEWKVETLLGLADAKTAGARIIERIEQDLTALDIGHLPARLPCDRNRRVLLYNQGRSSLGIILHLTRKLADKPEPDDGKQTDELVIGLRMLLTTCQKTLEEQAKVAQP